MVATVKITALKKVMKFDMWKQHLRSTVQYLVSFENTPKAIEGRAITEWFKVGEKVFIELYKLGNSIEWKYSDITKESDVTDVIAHFAKNQEWFQTFINIYPTLRIDLDLVGSANDICMTRSGIQVLLQGFKNIDTQFNRDLEDLQELGELDELDRCLKIWRDSGHRPDFVTRDEKCTVPEDHWWWH